MAYADSAVVTTDLHDIQSRSEKSERGFARRLFAALMTSRMRQAEREIALHLIARSFNDEVERDIERRFLSFPPYR